MLFFLMIIHNFANEFHNKSLKKTLVKSGI